MKPSILLSAAFKIYDRPKYMVAGCCTLQYSSLGPYSLNTKFLCFKHTSLNVYGPKHEYHSVHLSLSDTDRLLAAGLDTAPLPGGHPKTPGFDAYWPNHTCTREHRMPTVADLKIARENLSTPCNICSGLDSMAHTYGQK